MSKSRKSELDEDEFIDEDESDEDELNDEHFENDEFIGRIFIKRYEVVQGLHKGAFGIVYKVYDKTEKIQ